jgi:hypothetical protein
VTIYIKKYSTFVILSFANININKPMMITPVNTSGITKSTKIPRLEKNVRAAVDKNSLPF